MKCLSVCQPYANLIIYGEKRLENRTWGAPCRGPLLIHASKSREWLPTWTLGIPGEMHFGKIIGVVRVVGSIRVTADEAAGVRAGDKSAIDHLRAMCPPGFDLGYLRHAEGPWLWLLDDPRPLRLPVPARGMPGVFQVEADPRHEADGSLSLVTGRGDDLVPTKK